MLLRKAHFGSMELTSTVRALVFVSPLLKSRINLHGQNDLIDGKFKAVRQKLGSVPPYKRSWHMQEINCGLAYGA